MAKLFYGEWTVDVVESSGFGRRLIIHGSAASDGIYAVSAGLTISVSDIPGQGWHVTTETLRPQVRGAPEMWRPETLSTGGAGYTNQDGLVVFLSAKRMHLAWRGGILVPLEGDVVLRFRNIDPTLNPWHSTANPYDFTLPKQRKPRDPVEPQRRPDR